MTASNRVSTAEVVVKSVGDEPERAHAQGAAAVRHVVVGWATRAVLAETEVERLRAWQAEAQRARAAWDPVVAYAKAHGRVGEEVPAMVLRLLGARPAPAATPPHTLIDALCDTFAAVALDALSSWTTWRSRVRGDREVTVSEAANDQRTPADVHDALVFLAPRRARQAACALWLLAQAQGTAAEPHARQAAAKAVRALHDQPPYFRLHPSAYARLVEDGRAKTADYEDFARALARWAIEAEPSPTRQASEPRRRS